MLRPTDFVVADRSRGFPALRRRLSVWAGSVAVAFALLTTFAGSGTVSADHARAAPAAHVAAVTPPDGEGDGTIDERASFPTERAADDGSARNSLNLWSAVFVVGMATLAIGGWWSSRRPDDART